MILQPTNGSAFIAAKRLPDEYQEVEWIQPAASGGMVPLNITLDLNSADIIVDFYLVSNPNGERNYLFFSGTTSRCNGLIHGNGNLLTMYVNGDTGQGVNRALAGFKAAVGERHKMEINLRASDGTIKISADDGSKSSVLQYAPNTAMSGSMIAISRDASTTYASVCYKQYPFIMSDMNQYHLYVPCYRRSDSKAGVFDLQNNVFKPGTGSFILGNDIY